MTKSCHILCFAALFASIGCDSTDHGPSELNAARIADLPTWPVVRELEIGREDDEAYVLVPVGGIAVSPVGEIYVSQPQIGEIRVFDPNGEFVRSIGGLGQGPGEFRALREVGLIGDSVWAIDVAGGTSVRFFTTDGQPRGSRSVPSAIPRYLGAGQYYPLPDGRLAMPTASFGEMMEQDHEQPWLLWNAGDSLVAVLPGYSASAATVLSYSRTVSGRTIEERALVVPPLAQRTWVGIAPDGSSFVRAEYDPAETDTASVRLVRYTPDGDTLAAGFIEIPRAIVNAGTADSLVNRTVERVARVAGTESRARRDIAGVFSVPERFPPIRSLMVDADARAWLEVERGESSHWLLVDQSLAPLAWVALPGSFTPSVAEGQHVWGVERDQFDVPRVLRLRIDGAL